MVSNYTLPTICMIESVFVPFKFEPKQLAIYIQRCICETSVRTAALYMYVSDT